MFMHVILISFEIFFYIINHKFKMFQIHKLKDYYIHSKFILSLGSTYFSRILEFILYLIFYLCTLIMLSF